MIHPIDLIFGTYNELSLYFQLSAATWCLIGFNGNHSYINDVASGRHFEFLKFQILFQFKLITEFTKLLEFVVKVSVFSHFLAKS